MALPPIITIPLPTVIPYGKGLESTIGPQGCLIQTRGTVPEKDKIKRAAAKVGISYGAFMRRVANDAADFVLKYTEEQ